MAGAGSAGNTRSRALGAGGLLWAYAVRSGRMHAGAGACGVCG